MQLKFAKYLSSCIKDICDYEVVKKCGKCGNNLIKSIFNKNKNKSDGFYNQGKVCRKKYYNGKIVKIKKLFR